MAPKKAAPRKKIVANGRKMPEPIRPGEVLTDVTRVSWRLGNSIGVGGFGEIYLASSDITKTVEPSAEYVVKVEPHDNGPLFSEMHCYHRIAKSHTIDEWIRRKKLKALGMPRFIGSGSHEHNGQKYRFMVMERFGTDLQKLLEGSGHKFTIDTILTLGGQILDTLEYIHSREYIHADIKASNLLLGYKKGTENQVYLVDFGLACRYMTDGEHKPYKPDLRKAHDGTVEFTSRDAHIGAHSRRGDLEILGYNLVQWLCGRLPWENNLADLEYVHKQKSHYMDHISKLFSRCFPGGLEPGIEAVQKYMEYVGKLTFDAEPDYNRCRELLKLGFKYAGIKDNGKLNFVSVRGTRKKLKRRSDEELENISRLNPKKVVKSGPRRPCRPRNSNRSSPSSPILRSNTELEDFQWSDYFYTAQGENARLKSNSGSRKNKCSNSGTSRRKNKNRVDDEVEDAVVDTSLDNPTPAMRAVLAMIRAKASTPPLSQKQRNRNNSQKTSYIEGEVSDLTPAMEEVIRRKEEKRVSSVRVPDEWITDDSSDHSDISFHTPLGNRSGDPHRWIGEAELKDLFMPFWISEEQRSMASYISPTRLRSGALYSPDSAR